MSKSMEAIKAEIEACQRNGLIRPADVVEAARDENSALHECFEWDDTEAGHQYRLIQARQLIRVYVHVEEKEEAEPVRAFVSLTTDQRNPGGGYRTIAQVMSNEELREQMLTDALTRLRNLQKQYRSLTELAKVWDAVDAAEAKASRKSSRPARARKQDRHAQAAA
jgi:hypothetical protein